jgi:hypothetical protein
VNSPSEDQAVAKREAIEYESIASPRAQQSGENGTVLSGVFGKDLNSADAQSQ